MFTIIDSKYVQSSVSLIQSTCISSPQCSVLYILKALRLGAEGCWITRLHENPLSHYLVDTILTHNVFMLGIYGVGKAAIHQPALAILSHTPSGATETICWVGKGIVYDTGGLSIKGKVIFCTSLNPILHY